MVDITQLKHHINEEIRHCQQRLADFEQQLDTCKKQLRALQSRIEGWVAALEIDGVKIHYDDTAHTLEKFDETFQITLQEQTVSFGSCKLHVEPEEQYLHGNRILLFASSDEDDIKEIIESEGEYYFADLQFGQKRDLSKYEPLTEETFYKLLYGWLRA